MTDPDRLPSRDEMRREHHNAKDAVRRLSAVRPEQRVWLARNLDGLVSLEGVTQCAERCQDEIFRDLESASSWVECAILVADSLPGDMSESVVADCRIIAQIERANVLRIRGRFAEAMATIQDCHSLWRSGSSGDPLLLARMYSVSASLEAAVGWLDDAIYYVDRAIRVYSDCGEMVGMIRMLVKKSSYYARREQYHWALQVLRVASSVANRNAHKISQNDSGPLWCLYYNVIHCMGMLNPEKGRAALSAQRENMLSMSAQPGADLHLTWLEADLHRAGGDPSEAIILYREVWQGLAERGVHWRCVLVAVEMAECLLDHGDYQDAVTVLEDLREFYASVNGSSPEVGGVVDMLWRSARDGLLTTKILSTCRSHLKGLLHA